MYWRDVRPPKAILRAFETGAESRCAAIPPVFRETPSNDPFRGIVDGHRDHPPRIPIQFFEP
jgi:hypothetical protein